MTWVYPPKRILVPVDFGEASGKALFVAAAMAAQSGASLEALHVEVLEAPPYFTHDQVSALEAQRRNARAEAERYLRRFADRHGASNAHITIADGAAAEVILSRANDVDAIIMGTNDRGVAAKFWMGSVAERVRRDASAPVLIIHASAAGSPADYAQELMQEATRRRNG